MDADDIKRLLEKPTTLQDILDFREYTYSMLTREAIQLFGPTLTGAVNHYLNNTAEIDWTAIEPVNTLEGYVRVTGFSLPAIGSTITVEGKEVHIDKDNVYRYKQVIRFVLPIKLIESGNRNQLVAFIKDLSAIAAVATELEIENILKEYYFDDMKDLTSNNSYHKMLDRVTKPKEVMGFEATGLTDSQIAALHMYGACSSETKN